MRHITVLFVTVIIWLAMLSASCAENNAIENAYQHYRAIISNPGNDYSAIIGKIEKAERQLRKKLEGFPAAKDSEDVQQILTEIKEKKESLKCEQKDFFQLEKQLMDNHVASTATIEITDIKNFIERYPNSIKASFLTQRLDELHLKKFKMETQISLNSINDINKVLQTSEHYLKKIKDPNTRNKIRRKIIEFEKKRPSVYDKEFIEKIKELIAQMKRRAIQYAQGIHPASNIESIQENLPNGNIYSSIGRTEVLVQFTFNMRGKILGISRFRVVITAKGFIDGSYKQGTSYSLTGMEKTEDVRIMR